MPVVDESVTSSGTAVASMSRLRQRVQRLLATGSMAQPLLQPGDTVAQLLINRFLAGEQRRTIHCSQRLRDRARNVRQDLKRHSREPQWDLVKMEIAGPLLELRSRVSPAMNSRPLPPGPIHGA